MCDYVLTIELNDGWYGGGEGYLYLDINQNIRKILKKYKICIIAEKSGDYNYYHNMSFDQYSKIFKSCEFIFVDESYFDNRASWKNIKLISENNNNITFLISDISDKDIVKIKLLSSIFMITKLPYKIL